MSGEIGFEGITSMEAPKHPLRCGCGRRMPCSRCEAAELAADAAARRFAAAQGAELPAVDAGRLLGGNLERRDRGNPLDRARDFEDRRELTMTLRDYHEYAEDRAKALDVALEVFGAERRMLGRHVKFLGARLDAERALSLEQVARAIGIPRCTVFALDLEVRVQALLRLRIATMPILCSCAACGAPVTDLLERDAVGIRIFCGPVCRERAEAIGAALVLAADRVPAKAEVATFCTICECEFRYTQRRPPKTCSPECRAVARAKTLEMCREASARKAAPGSVGTAAPQSGQTAAA